MDETHATIRSDAETRATIRSDAESRAAIRSDVDPVSVTGAVAVANTSTDAAVGMDAAADGNYAAADGDDAAHAGNGATPGGAGTSDHPHAIPDPRTTFATVSNVQRYSLHDGGGIRTNVFLKGCPFRCPWCCNPENLSREPQVSFNQSLCMGCSKHRPGERLCVTDPADCPMGAKEWVGTVRSAAQVVEEVVRDATFYEESGGGVTLSGGEALLWPEFCEAFLAAAGKEGLDRAMETTLAVPLPNLRAMAGLVDRWLVDFKIADRQHSLAEIGLDPVIRDRQLTELLALGATVIARMPIIPGHTDDRANVEANLDRIRELGIARVDILPFHQLGSGKYDSIGRPYTMADIPQLPDDAVTWIQDLAREKGLDARLHGE